MELTSEQRPRELARRSTTLGRHGGEDNADATGSKAGDEADDLGGGEARVESATQEVARLAAT